MSKYSSVSAPGTYLDFIHHLKFVELPPKLVQKAQFTRLDTCGVTAAGSRMRAALLMKKFAIHNFAQEK